MKKITKEEKLVADEVKHSILPIENCKFWNDTAGFDAKGSLTAIYGGEYAFFGYSKSKPDQKIRTRYCAKIIERYPRDVPEGVAPLPDDKPYLAYLGLFDTDKLTEGRGHCFFLDERVCEWCPITITHATKSLYHTAIDVSTDWAQKKLPELVEAMEYEAITEVVHHCDGSWLKKVGYKLGSKYYNLDWQEVTSEGSLTLEPKDVFREEVPEYALTLKEGLEAQKRNDVASEDSAEDGYVKGFRDGMARQRWLDRQWKFKTARDAYVTGNFPGSFPDFVKVWDAARELRGGAE